MEKIIEDVPDETQKTRSTEITPTDYVGMVNLLMVKLLAKKEKKPNSVRISQDIARIQLQANVCAIGIHLQQRNEMHGHREKRELDPN